MLSKNICQKCWCVYMQSRYPSWGSPFYGWGWAADERWKEGWVSCVVPHSPLRTSIRDDPPVYCPYKFEHGVCAVKSNVV